MSSLLTLSPQSREVTIGDDKINVFGWSAEAIADLLASYRDEIQGVVTSFKEASDQGQSFQQIITGADTAVLDTLSQSVIPTAVVWATRLPRTSSADILKAEAVVRDLPFTTQLLFLKSAYDLTFPSGVADFLTALGLAAAQDESATS